ncbi:MAG TPA: ABC transporter permease, partial [Acidimicrobiia bacterium]|nr:ABC transporter permease [Acidimicrobiia bacterium]
RMSQMAPEHRVSEVWDDAPSGRSRGPRLIEALSSGGPLAQIVSLLSLLVIWQLFVMVSGIRPYLLPAPTQIFVELFDSFSVLIEHTWVTLVESLAGFLIAAVVGVGLAVVMVAVPFLRGLVMPGLVAFNVVPKVAFAPLLIIWLGLGIQSKIALSFLIAFFPIVVNTITGLIDIEPEMLNLVKLMKARSRLQFTKIRLPHALPAMFDGFKIALPIAIIGAIVAEFVASSEGLGYLIVAAGVQLNTTLVFASIFMIVIFSMVLYALLLFVESRFLSWRPSAR